MLEQAEMQFKVSNLKGEASELVGPPVTELLCLQYGAYGLLQRARDKFEEAGLLEARTKSLEELEAKYRSVAQIVSCQ
eukprot:754010-Hanusia_phi.AAC.4